VARECFERKKENYTGRIWGRVEKELFPLLACRAINEIEAPECSVFSKKLKPEVLLTQLADVFSTAAGFLGME
jgi:hypothetical protein